MRSLVVGSSLRKLLWAALCVGAVGSSAPLALVNARGLANPGSADSNPKSPFSECYEQEDYAKATTEQAGDHGDSEKPAQVKEPATEEETDEATEQAEEVAAEDKSDESEKGESDEQETEESESIREEKTEQEEPPVEESTKEVTVEEKKEEESVTEEESASDKDAEQAVARAGEPSLGEEPSDGEKRSSKAASIERVPPLPEVANKSVEEKTGSNSTEPEAKA